MEHPVGWARYGQKSVNSGNPLSWTPVPQLPSKAPVKAPSDYALLTLKLNHESRHFLDFLVLEIQAANATLHKYVFTNL